MALSLDHPLYILSDVELYNLRKCQPLQSGISNASRQCCVFILHHRSKCAGAFLIYSVVSKLVLEQQKIIELQTRNHQLSTQTLQYEKLQVFLTNIFFSVKILPSMQFFHIFPSRHVHLGSLTLFPLRFQNIFLFQRQIYPFYLEIFWKML